MEKRFDLIVIPQERDEQVRGPVLEDEAWRDIAATLENFVAQLTDSQVAVHMRAQLTCSGHHSAQDIVDARRIAISVALEPVVNVAVQAGGDQHFGRTAELR